MFLRTFLKAFIPCLLSVTLLLGTFTACTTNDSKSESEGELDSELDDLSDSSDKIDGDSDSAEDDEFLAEDADKPAASDDALAEDDLEKELDKGKSDLAADENPEPADEAAPAPVVTQAAPPPPPPMAEEPMPVAPRANDTMITSKESNVSNDNFEYINPAPTLPKDDLGVSDPLVSEVDPPLPSVKAAQELVPMPKVRKEPFNANGRVMNTVYVARPGEDLKTISMKIYGEDKTANLLADNPPTTRGVEPGTLIYYTSPNRPEDEKTIMTYYEDSKMAPSYYTTKQGDDIQKIGRRVLGFEDAWREIWATNESLQSQALLPEGLKIKYWSGNEAKNGATAFAEDPLTTVGAAGTITEPQVTSKAPEPTAEAPIDIPGPPTEYTDTAALPEDPSMMSGAAAGTQTAAEPPPILPDTAGTSPAVAPATEESSLGTVAGIALVIIAVMALIAMQIKNRKKSDAGLPPSLEFTKV